MEEQKLLLETVADISYLAGEKRFYSGDSRADISEFIRWAIEFQRINTETNWDEHNYLLLIETFTQQKLLTIKKKFI
jgi:hypothetical protein